MSVDHSKSRKAGDRLIVAQAQRQVQTFFDELKNGTLNYRTIASLDGQIVQAYRGRCILELLQNAHDALANAQSGDPQQISFVLRTSPEPVLLIGNSGRPFRPVDFEGLCQLGQSPKDPNKSVGNKGLGFRSVLEVSTIPEIWSTAPAGSDTSFVFRFDPLVSNQVAAAAQEIEEKGLDARSPFDPEFPLLDWSQKQLEQYRKRMINAQLDGAHEAGTFLSPYLIPLTMEGLLPEVESLLSTGHVTVVRLGLDGGRPGNRDEAIRSVKYQLEGLNAQSTVFLPDLKRLVIDIDDERHIIERVVDSDGNFTDHPQTRQQCLSVRYSGPAPDDHTTRQFQLWTRTIGGDDYPEQAERIRAVVEHLPNRWPEVRQVVVGVSVEEASAPDKGLFVIFLPTKMATGTGAHVNAPFYGSLDRRQINLDDPYNKLLLVSVLNLCLDAVTGLVSEKPEEWRARAVIDLLSSTATVSGQDWCLMDELHARALERGNALNNQALILCDDGWCVPRKARTMPEVSDNAMIGVDHWRDHAAFAIVSTALDGRRSAVEALVTKLDGSLSPTTPEWLQTVDQVATSVQDREINVTWGAFLTSLVEVLPADFRSEPRDGTPDPLASARFLPEQDGRLIIASDSAKLFFQPVRGVDDAADLVGEVPNSLKHRVAFLHPSIQTQQGPQRRNTPVQKFLDGRFARGFRQEELLRDVVIAALPSLPVPHGSDDADLCSELFIWTLKLLNENPPDALLPLLKRLPVACHGGWLAMGDAVFGPGWPDRIGDHVWSLVHELPENAATRLRETTLLPPDDPRWGVAVKDLDGLFTRVGVVDGLRLHQTPDIRFNMQGSIYELPSTAPTDTPQEAWDDWRRSVQEEAKPYYTSWFEYSLSGVNLLPEIHHLETLSRPGRNALSRVLLASLALWPTGWQQATIRKRHGADWSKPITSPLRHWLTTQPWLSDRTAVERPLSHRWLVPASLLRGQGDRFQHLNPLSLDLSRRLEAEPKLKAALNVLGLNIYPLEEDLIGPELLEALAAAWAAERVSIGRYDVFLGQVRDAWRHLDPQKGLPETLLVRTGHRMFSAHGQDELAGIYLPDNRDRTRSLLEHGKHILEMHASDAGRMAEALLSATDIRRSSTLEERFLIDGVHWTGAADGLPSLEESRYAWLPVPLLTIAAHGGTNPAGVATKAWRDAAEGLRRALFVECEAIAAQLVDGDAIVAESDPAAQWLPSDVLAIRRDVRSSYESLAPAAQAMLGRQDLLKDLRLVLGSFSGRENPTLEQIEAALELAEIDAQAFADVRNQWAGTFSLLVDRITPVAVLLGVSSDGFDAAATDIERLTEWLSSNIPQWSASEMLSAARTSRDDHVMGLKAWHALGDIAQLPTWNAALTKLGDRYGAVENHAIDDQTAAHVEGATPLLRGLARHVAIEVHDPNLFHKLEALSQNFEAHDDWRTRWWEVPFTAVIAALHTRYAELPGAARYLEVLEGARTVDDLRMAFLENGIATDPDPYEIARQNKDGLDNMLSDVHDLHRTWVELTASNSVAPEPPEPPVDLDLEAYLHPWSEADLLYRAYTLSGNSEFVDASDGCASLNEIRDRLGLDREAVEARRQERREQVREAERERRTFDVAGTPFEIGTNSYGELFEHLNRLADPAGPRASKDGFTLLTTPPSTGVSGRGGGRGGKGSHLRPSPELRELVGIVGEIHAYRFLRKEFGNNVVPPDAWVSEIRLKVLPLVTGEPDNTSDGHGFDFRFSHHGRRWHVEVKATMSDESHFDLGISEIEAATRFARKRKRGGRWRILRVRNALSVQPEFDWLPNPFEEGFKENFRHRQPIEGAAAGHLDVTPDGEEPAKRMGRSRGGPDRPAARPSTPGMREVRWAEVVGSEPVV